MGINIDIVVKVPFGSKDLKVYYVDKLVNVGSYTQVRTVNYRVSISFDKVVKVFLVILQPNVLFYDRLV